MKIDLKKLPEEVFEIFRIFNEREADCLRLVGGCVRDLLLEKEITDYDFATKLTPEESIRVIAGAGFKAIPTGVKYGTVTALVGDFSFEITTLRSDENSDGRHPEAKFVEDYLQDAKRRDFTMNALYLDQNGEIYDYFNGIDDLRGGIVKFIGEPDQRIKEDYLRIMRFFRFTAIYANDVNEEGLEACLANKSGMEILSGDRIREELIKFFNAEDEEFLLEVLSLMEDEGVRQEILPVKFNITNLELILDLEEQLEVEFSAKLLLFGLIFDGQKNLKEAFAKLNISNSDKKYYSVLSRYVNSIDGFLGQKDLQKLSVYLKKELLLDLYLFKTAQNLLLLEDINIDKIWQNIDFINDYQPPIFPVNGDDLLKMGFEGVKIGEILTELKEKWVESGFKFKKDELLKNA